MKSLIIVESHNDKYFIEKLRDILDLENIELKEPVCKMADYECLNGLSEKKLQLTLNDIKFDEYQKIGIIIDADNEGIQKRIDLINSCIRTLEEVPEDFQITKINEFIKRQNQQDKMMKEFAEKMKDNLDKSKSEKKDEFKEELQKRLENVDKDLEKNKKLLV